MRDLFKFLLLCAVLMLSVTHAQQNDASDQPLFVKVFAGISPSSWGDFRRQVRKNLKRKEALPESTKIPCETGRYYALGAIASHPGRQMLSFETTAIFRDLDNYEAPRTSHREYTLRKEEFGTRRFSFKIRKDAVDHDMTLVVHIGKTVYLRHKFEIRGCQAGAEDDV